jgi:hypothetical protein
LRGFWNKFGLHVPRERAIPEEQELQQELQQEAQGKVLREDSVQLGVIIYLYNRLEQAISKESESEQNPQVDC